jgi:acetyl-CoA acetyltransferase
MSNDVAIIGVGIHPFGRFDKTAMEMGAEAIQGALADAKLEWKDIQFGFGGSYEVSNPDAVTRLVGLTGITFTNVFNACATSASAIQQTADTIRLGKYDIGAVVCQQRSVRDHQVLRDEGQPLHPQARHLRGDAGAGGEQELPQR